MVKAYLQKLLLEDDFLLDAFTDLSETLKDYEIEETDIVLIDSTFRKIGDFFNTAKGDDLIDLITRSASLKADIFEYARERITYLLAGKDNQYAVQEIIWVS